MSPKVKQNKQRTQLAEDYFNFFDYIASIATDPNLRALAEKCKLEIVRVSWEDTARNKNSCFGPNISDMTLFAYKNGEQGEAMPMIRMGSNYEDLTVDRKAEDFTMPVGNETGGKISKATLKDYLTNFGQYCGNSAQKSLYDEKRDSQIQVSMQYCVLPLHEGEVEFAVQLFNYQSDEESPAVLVLVVSNEGTSAQVVTEAHQKLYLNSKGRAHSFSAKRLSEDRKDKGKTITGAMDAEEKNQNYLMIFQIPLKQKLKPRRQALYYESCSVMMDCSETLSYKSAEFSKSKSKGIEHAIIKKGLDRGKFVGVKKSGGNFYELIRDTDYSIRCTVQKYQVTDTKEISPRVFGMMADDIQTVYKSGVAFGSHVVDGPKEGVPDRLTTPADLDSEKAKMATLTGVEKGKEVYSDPAKNKDAGLKPLFSAFA